MAVDPRSGRPTVALLTDPTLPSLGPDDAPLVAAFEAAGWATIPCQWREPVAGHDLALIRSCWDYAAHRDEFLERLAEWADLVPLWNPLDTVRWNSSKRYLLELQSRGHALPATVIVEAGASTTLADAMRAIDSTGVVVKPLIGAAGIDTWRTSAADDPRWEQRRGAVLVQAFVPEIESEGELSLVWFRDGYSHAVNKRPAAGEFRVQAEHGGRTTAMVPSQDVIRQAERVLASVAHPWSYARVDGVVSGGCFVLMELELVEPELFFRHAPRAATRFVATLTASRG